MYKFTTNHIRCNDKNVPILVGDGDSGLYDRDSTLPHTNGSTARAFAMRNLSGELLPWRLPTASFKFPPTIAELPHPCDD
jgi:hypothetical protein